MLRMIDTYKMQLKASEQEIQRLQDNLIKQGKGYQTVNETQVKIRDLQNKQDTV